ncbi:hypothetical protein [Chromobacterium violaceum]|uniref:hypothetical protein n=1 Tax=Chromobacterium violaceum TaxID=536 RepID=UPI00194E86DB|nr:hypothetical protein [Chromobacterium violaceum]QRO34142.1 hypothetical protein I6K04_05195 [Chromobacterium violaceum]QRQ16055.1 hypothetical protein I6K03_17535 [Chromobacterium violaceum]
MRIDMQGVETLHRVLDKLGEVERRQLPFATAVGLNNIAERIRRGEREVMRQRFDRPTPYTLDALYVRRASKSKLVAEVNIKDSAYKAAPASLWLNSEITGGDRRQKRSEKALGRVSGGKFWTPAPGAALDGYGNVGRGFLVKVLSALKAHGEQGYIANRSKSKRSQRKARNFDIFVGAPNGEPMGVWQRINSAHGHGLKPLLWMQDQAPTYRVRFPFDKIAANIYRAHAPEEFERAIRLALATARG